MLFLLLSKKCYLYADNVKLQWMYLHVQKSVHSGLLFSVAVSSRKKSGQNKGLLQI
jgi:hypothetical protein